MCSHKKYRFAKIIPTIKNQCWILIILKLGPVSKEIYYLVVQLAIQTSIYYSASCFADLMSVNSLY